MAKFGAISALAFVLLLALAGAIWGVQFILMQFGVVGSMWSESWQTILFWVLVVAMLMGFSWTWRSPPLLPGAQFYVPRPVEIDGADKVVALWRVIKLPYDLRERMEFALNGDEIADPPIFATITDIDRSISKDIKGSWTIATLKLENPADFERLLQCSAWTQTREDGKASSNTGPTVTLERSTTRH
jgi:hypothetical protein